MHRELVIQLRVNHVSTKEACAVVCSLCSAVSIARLLYSASLVGRDTTSTGG